MRQIDFASRCGILLAAAGLLTASVPGRAQNPVKNKELYNGQATDVEGLRLGSWGSGRAKEDTTKKAIGDTSIRVETNGYYAGGRIEFDEPRELTDQKSDPFGYLAFTVFFQPGKPKKNTRSSYPGYPGSSGSSGSSGGFPGSPGGFSGSPSGFPGSSGGSPGGFGTGSPGGFPGAPGGYPGYPGGGQEEQQLQPDTSKLKVVLKCEEGTFVASNFPVSLIPASEEGWFQVAVPFVAFKGLDKAATCKLKEIRIFGDSKDTFWIGEIRTTTDEEPIAVEPLDDAEISVQEPVEFRAQATGGISPLQYSWDFDISDGIQEDAVGPVVTHTYRKASPDVTGSPGEVQPYVVTLTVKDLSGAKRSVRKQANVIVNP